MNSALEQSAHKVSDGSTRSAIKTKSLAPSFVMLVLVSHSNLHQLVRIILLLANKVVY
jgi:hypothetical protein